MGYSGFYVIEGRTYYPSDWDGDVPSNSVNLSGFRIENCSYPNSMVQAMATAIFLTQEIARGTMILDINLLSAVVELYMYQTWLDILSNPSDKNVDRDALRAKIIDFEQKYQSLLPSQAIIPLCAIQVGTK